MSSKVYLTDTSILQKLAGNLSEFQSGVNESLRTAQTEVDHFQTWIERRLMQMDRKRQVAEDRLHKAIRILEDCQRRSDDRSSGGCYSYEREVEQARKELSNITHQIMTARRHKARIDQDTARMRAKATQLNSTCSSAVMNGKTLLQKSIQSIEGYAGGGTGSSSAGFSMNSIASKGARKFLNYEQPSIGSSGRVTTKRLNKLRNLGVSRAWAQERALVSVGGGTRKWTRAEREILLKNGRVPGYEAHHIRNVHDHHPRWAADPRNLMFVSKKAHLQLHLGDFHNRSVGNLIDREAIFNSLLR